MSRFGFGNLGRYRGETLPEMIAASNAAAEAKAQELIDQIIELAGPDEYDRWLADQPDQFSWHEFNRWAEARIEDLQTEECYCNGLDQSCPACRHAAYRAWSAHDQKVFSIRRM